MGATATADDPIQQAADTAVAKVRMFQFSSWLHVGPGADECGDVNEETGEVSCSDPRHFHAWCRLPNQFQHKEIREKGLAAKARRARQLRDPDSDAAVILEADIDELRAQGDAAKDSIVDLLLERTFLRTYGEAQREVREEVDGEAVDGEDPPLRWEFIERDKKRLEELHGMTEPPADELAELEKHVATYNQRVNEVFEERRNPERDALMALPLDQLLDQLRTLRIDQDSNAEFEHVYAVHQWLECVLGRPNGEPKFASLKQLTGAAPEVLEALQLLYRDLEVESFRRRAEGNS